MPEFAVPKNHLNREVLKWRSYVLLVAGRDPPFCLDVSMTEVWIRTDTDREAVDGLEMAVEQMRLVSVDPYRWKWVILAAHNALTCFMCVTVAGSDQLGAMDERYIKAWRNAYDSDKQLSNDQERS